MIKVRSSRDKQTYFVLYLKPLSQVRVSCDIGLDVG
jgi:hypothetical protein